jgi:membrane-associated phospholipid phosphatase
VASRSDLRRLADRRALLAFSGTALLVMAALAWAVGPRSTGLDDWFHRFFHTPLRQLLVFTNPLLLAYLIGLGVIVAACTRRWRLAVVMVAAPILGVASARLLKQLFGRESDGVLAYPSGHTTAAVIIAGMLVLLAGAALWSVLAAVAYVVLAMIGQGVTYHYFTDTVGALLLGSAVVCVAALFLKLDTRQPGCDLDHSCR